MDVPEHTRTKWGSPSTPVFGKELALEPGNIDTDRALRLARLAADAQFHHLIHAFAGEFGGRQAAGHGRTQSIGAATGGVFFFTRNHEAGAHRPRCALAADTCAVAHFHSAVEAHVAAEVEVWRDGDDCICFAVAQIFGHGRGVDEIAGVKNVVGVEGGFDLLVQFVQVGAEEFFIEPAARTAVSVFAGERAAVPAQQVYGELRNLRQFGDFFGFFCVD